MRSPVVLRLVGAVLITGLIGSACSDDCPNCPGPPATVVVSPDTSSVLLDAGATAGGPDLRQEWEPAERAPMRPGRRSDDDHRHGGRGWEQSRVLRLARPRSRPTAAGLKGDGTVLVVTSSTLSQQVQPILETSCAQAFCHVTGDRLRS